MEGIMKGRGVNRGGIVTGGHLLRSRDFGSHSMYHQMLIPSASSSPPPPFSSFLLPFSSLHAAAAAPSSPSSVLHCSQVGKEPGMEALRSSLRPETASSPSPAPQQLSQEGVFWGAEKAGLPSEGFSVDELLNLGEFGENEKERVENEEEEVVEQEAEAEAEAVTGDQEVKKMEAEEHAASSSSFSSSSVLSREGSRPLSEISLPAHDAEDLEWVSFIIDDSLSEFPAEVATFLPQVQTNAGPHGAAVATATVCAVSTEAPVPPKAKRSKRPRTVTVGWSTSLPLADSSSTTTTSASSCHSASSSSCLIYDQPAVTGDQSYLVYESHPSLAPPPPPPSKKTKLPKKRGRKPRQQPASAAASGAAAGAASSGERRCSHCGAQKTPQWRAGPLGAKTLCNACGVRYKSGRLLPEYRPACSPTYVDSIHSSSHRKVLELRRQKEAELLLVAVGPTPVATC